MMEIYIVESNISFKAPQTGTQTRAIKEHYNGRRIIAEVDGDRRSFFLEPDDIQFEATQEDLIMAIEAAIESENQQEG